MIQVPDRSGSKATRSIPGSAKLWGLDLMLAILLAGSLVLPMVLIARPPVTIVLTIVGIAAGTHILSLKTARPKIQEPD